MANLITSVLSGLELSPIPHLLLEDRKIIGATASCLNLFGDDAQEQLLNTDVHQWILADSASFADGIIVKIRKKAGGFFQAFVLGKQIDLGDKKITVVSVSPYFQRTSEDLNLISHMLTRPIAQLQSSAASPDRMGSVPKPSPASVSNSIEEVLIKYRCYRKIEDGCVSNELSIFNPIEVLKGLVKTRQKESAALWEIETDFPERMRNVVLDQDKVAFMLKEILGNAIMHNAIGEIRVSIACHDEPESNHWTVIIQDNGNGLPPSALESLCEKMGSPRIARSGGGGIGLTICAAFAKQLEGKLSIISTEGVGTTVELCLPFELSEKGSLFSQQKDEWCEVEEPVAGIRRSQSESEVKEKNLNSFEMSSCSEPVLIGKGKRPKKFGFRALVVDDSLTNLKVLTSMLSRFGLRCQTAVDGQEAVEIIRSNPHAFDIIFMDLMMPVMDGFKATEAIHEICKEKKATLVVVACTANTEDHQKCYDAGMKAVLTKPLEKQNIRRVLSDL